MVLVGEKKNPDRIRPSINGLSQWVMGDEIFMGR